MENYELSHAAAVRSLSPECAVLLKSDGTLPFDRPCKIALYGNGARYTVKGGTGSGDVNTRYIVTVEQGLKDAGFDICTGAWLDSYDFMRARAKERFVEDVKRLAREKHTNAIMLGMGLTMPEPDYNMPLEGQADTAVYILSRQAGEGNDRKDAPGDLRLTKSEIRDILECEKKYKRFVLVLNLASIVDLSPVIAVKNILLLSQLGSETGNVLADLLLGKAYPSGRLSATWAKADDYPSMGDFGDNNDTYYREGVYVGYRYFDSAAVEPLFPFGYGLGYTEFSFGAAKVSLDGELVTVSAKVKNTGSRPGKETAQVYVTAPWGKLDKPYQSLAGFKKSGKILPGESEELSVEFKLSSLASYDSSRCAYILEPGVYTVRLGANSRSTKAVARLTLEEEVIVKTLSSCGGQCGFEDWKCEHGWSDEKSRSKKLAVDASAIKWEKPAYPYASNEAVSKAKSLSDSELIELCIGKHGSGVASVIGSASMAVPGAAGDSYGEVEGVPSITMADGPAGLRLNRQYSEDESGKHPIGNTLPAGLEDFMSPMVRKIMGGSSSKKVKGVIKEQNCTAIPVGTAIAQSWNISLAEQLADLVGDEMERFGVNLWLAPGMNIQRHVLCGRNFEYYSEDPLLTGKMAAAITRGVQKHPGRGVTVKHFCANNQETNRFLSCSNVSERALREIYLKGFEICITESAPAALMTSYNLLNGVHTSERSDILIDILRGEWGYKGLVMSDWVVGAMIGMGPKGKYSGASCAASIKAGNDIFMPGSSANVSESVNALRGKDKRTKLSRAELERCAARVIDWAWILVK